jgi:PIN domain nuclease of toxin-antitoxin system
MKLLLDTQIFIWWADNPEKLSKTALSALEDNRNDLLLSVASVWEMQIKMRLGKSRVSPPIAELVQSQQASNDITVLPVTLPHVLALDSLPAHHKHPFDRLLIAQSIEEDATLLRVDPQFLSYPIKLLQ